MVLNFRSKMRMLVLGLDKHVKEYSTSILILILKFLGLWCM